MYIFCCLKNVPRNKIGTFLNVLSEQNSTEHFFGGERSVLTEHLDLMFPRTLNSLQINLRILHFPLNLKGLITYLIGTLRKNPSNIVPSVCLSVFFSKKFNHTYANKLPYLTDHYPLFLSPRLMVSFSLLNP